MTKFSGTHATDRSHEIADPKAFASNMAEQLRVAGLVQRDFLPGDLPNSELLQWGTIFLPAEWVSGDIYDIVRVDESHIGFYVADVVGHGMPAALLTMFLKHALAMRQTIGNSYHIFSPAEVMTNLNTRMTEQKLSGNQFATCCYCLLNTKTLRLTYSRAGHPYPILIPRGQMPKQLEIQGSLLGIFENTKYLEQTIQLAQGDKLLLYSDGAEPFIGTFEDQSGFHFTRQFCEIKDLPIVDMAVKLNELAEKQRTSSKEVDDITAVGLEIM